MSFKIILLFASVFCMLQEIRSSGLWMMDIKENQDLPPTDLATPIIPSGSVETKKYALGLFFKANWFRAAQYCKWKGMMLATINSQQEQEDIEAVIGEVGFEITDLWTSGTDYAAEREYFWMSTGVPVTYTKWLYNQPEGGSDRNCLLLSTRGGQGYFWSDAMCSTEYYFICEYYPSMFTNQANKPAQFI